jgi:hypothetical protein
MPRVAACRDRGFGFPWARCRLPDVFRRGLNVERSGEEVALGQITTHRRQHVELFRVLDAFGDGLETEISGKTDDGLRGSLSRFSS